ncbi:MAG: signal peptide peptidase SppA [Salinibacter sp.]
MRFFSTLAASVLGTLLAFGIVVFVVFFFLFALALSSDTTPSVESGSVLTVPMEGSIPETAADDPFRQAFGEGAGYDLRDLQTALRNATQDDRIEAVWLRMKGTSAEWATLEEVRQAVQQASDNGVPVIASSEEFGMSEKDYFVASAADSVYVGPQSGFEYNGFSTILSFFDGTFDKLGVEPQVVRAGKFKSAAETFVRSDLSDENRLQLNALLSTTNTQFTEAIAADRSLSADSLATMADEDPLLTATAAADEGLIDGLRYEDEVRSVLETLVPSAPTAADLSTVPLSSYKRVSPSSADVSYTGSGTVDIVYAEGNIVPGDPDDSPFSSGQQALGASALIDALEEARTSTSTQAVVLRINSPGGSASASESMWRAVDRTAQEKPVIVSMGDVAASGGYYIAAAADTVMANPTTVTGSIGVIGLLLNAEDFFEDQLGVTFDGVQTSPYADMYSSSRPLSENERRLIGQSIDQTYETFLERVAEGRGMDTSAVHDIAQGRVWSGQDAQDVGLVDTLGTLPDAVAIAGRAGGLGDGPYRTRELPRPKTVFERLNESFSTQATELWYATTATSLERKLWHQKRVLDRIVGQEAPVQTRLPYTPTVE